jgi:thiamine biosynthesis lipoprotein
MKYKEIIGFAVILLISCSNPKTSEYEYNDFIFGSYLRIKISAQDSLQAQQAISIIMQTLHHIDSIASSFNPESEITKLNEQGSAVVSSDLKALITKAVEVSEKSHGAFDITVGSAMQAFYAGRETVSSAVIDYKKISIKGDSIFLLPHMTLDLGGLAVGYALDKAVAVLKAHNIKNGLIDAGGDIVCFGDKVYTIGVKNPNREGTIKTIQIKNQAISTSGNYEKYIERDGQKYAHIINPKTAQAIGETPGGLISVTIITDKCVDADAYATAVFVSGLEHGQILIHKLKLQGVLITNDGKIIEAK